MKQILVSLLVVFSISGSALAQNSPSFGNPDTIKIIAGSGINQVIIPSISDGNDNSQIINFSAISSDTSLVKFVSAQYSEGNRLGYINIKEKGIKGKAVLTITAQDADGSFSRDVPVSISGYNNPGIKMSVYDIVFWQNAAPDETVASVFDTIINQFDGPFNSLNYNNIPLTVGVSSGVGLNQFFTGTIHGYLTPPVTGDYKFTFTASDNGDFYLSNDGNLTNKVKLLTDSWDKTDSTTGPIHLEAGKIYGIYADLHVINSRQLTVQWEGPGIDRQVIPGQYLMPSFDGTAPTTPGNLNVKIKAVNELIVQWSSSADNSKVKGYRVYLDGVPENSVLIDGTFYKISGLAAASAHSIAVLAEDMAGNKSPLSNIINDTTYGTDTNAPGPPTSMSTITATGQAVKVRWSGAMDNETQVIGYNVYVNGSLYNTVGPIYADSLVMTGLTPLTSFNIEIESIDAGYNLSIKSNAFHTSTQAFDPLGPDLGEKRGRMKIILNNISWTEGIGLNGPYEDGSMISDAGYGKIVKEFRPGVIRWGTLSANTKSFAASTGTGKANTYARMMNFANSIGAYFSLTIGVQDGLDFRTNPIFFTHLMNYLGDSSSDSYGGMLRHNEGFNQPLLPKSKGLIIEFGNEVWGAAAHNAEIGGNYTTYAKWCRDMSLLIKASPWYDPNKIIMAYSGRNPHPDDSYGLTQLVLTGDTGNLDCLAVSGYLGGNMNYDPNLPMGASELEYYKFRIAQVSRNADGFIQSMKEMLRLTGTVKSFYLYESNATTPSYNGRLGQAIVMTDFMTNSMRYGSIVPTIFTLDGGEWRIIQHENNNKRLPLFITGKYFNTWCKGNILQTQFESTNKIKDGYGALMNWDAVGVSAYNRDSAYSLLLFSRDFENDYTVQIDLPDDFTFNSSATKYVIHGNDFSTYDAIIDSSNIVLSDSMLITVPKYSMVLITFVGENRHFMFKPLGNFDRIRPTKVTIVPETDTVLRYNAGKLYFKAIVEPADAFSSIAIMKLSDNPINAGWMPFGTGGRYYIKGSGACSGNGNAVISAYAADDHSVRDQQIIEINNQGSNCGTVVNEISTDADKLVYPNPVVNQLNIGDLGGKLLKVSIYDITGRIVLDQNITDDKRIDCSKLPNGLYIIKLETDKKILSERFIKQ